ncbi:hypothetical protein L2E82_38094 [Cichorium intybus]|uniref:Uncharacterized protein n=1 Tax=Cichorium intybus TaxID=13427 RepID=A0ACB9AG75_CICIN|nr:hypothetical protein L2E82_38094 [Cichorium intybus]
MLSLSDDGLHDSRLSFSDDGLHDSRLSFSDDGLHDSRHSLYDDGYLHDSRETTVIDDDSVDSETVGSFCTMSQVLVHWRPTEEEAIYNYFVSNIAAYVPTVQQKQGKCTSISNSTTNISFASAGERYISKVKALEAGKAAKRRQDEKEKERRLKKEAFKMERERVKKEKEREMELNRKIKQEEMKKKEADMAARRKEREKEERAKRRKEEKRMMRWWNNPINLSFLSYKSKKFLVFLEKNKLRQQRMVLRYLTNIQCLLFSREGHGMESRIPIPSFNWQAIDTRDALVKFVYRWLVETFNKSLKGDSVRSISILYIYGFESFQEYESEGIEWKKVGFVDNQLFEKRAWLLNCMLEIDKCFSLADPELSCFGSEADLEEVRNSFFFRLLHASLNASTSPDCSLKVLLECKKASLRVPHLFDGMEEGRLMGCKVKNLTETLSTNKKQQQAIDTRDALVKFVYRWLVETINKSLKGDSVRSISILYIYGFESFQEYESEGIEWKKVEFVDNQLFEKISDSRRLSSMAEILFQCIALNASTSPDCSLKEIFHHKLCPPGARCNAMNLVSARLIDLAKLRVDVLIGKNGAKNCYNLFSNLYTDIDRDMQALLECKKASLRVPHLFDGMEEGIKKVTLTDVGTYSWKIEYIFTLQQQSTEERLSLMKLVEVGRTAARLMGCREYESEGIERKKVEFVDNQLFEKKTGGLLSILDEASSTFKATDLTLNE